MKIMRISLIYDCISSALQNTTSYITTYMSANSSTWKNASSTSSSYSFTTKASYNGRSIRCKVTDKYGNTVQSKTVKLTVK